MRRDGDDGEVDGVVAGEGAAGNAFSIKEVVVMRRSCSRSAVLVMRSRVRVLEAGARDWCLSRGSLQMRCARWSSRE